MVGRQLAIPRALVITFNRIMQRCSNPGYADYLRRSQQQVFYKNLNRAATIALGIMTLALVVAVAVTAWEEVISLAY